MNLTLIPTNDEAFNQSDEEAFGIRAWRAEQLWRLGLPRLVAETLADVVDWHALADLVERGCPPALAVEIIR